LICPDLKKDQSLFEMIEFRVKFMSGGLMEARLGEKGASADASLGSAAQGSGGVRGKMPRLEKRRR
jgi:hypothetical protein